MDSQTYLAPVSAVEVFHLSQEMPKIKRAPKNGWLGFELLRIKENPESTSVFWDYLGYNRDVLLLLSFHKFTFTRGNGFPRKG